MTSTSSDMSSKRRSLVGEAQAFDAENYSAWLVTFCLPALGTPLGSEPQTPPVT